MDDVHYGNKQAFKYYLIYHGIYCTRGGDKRQIKHGAKLSTVFATETCLEYKKIPYCMRHAAH